MSKEDQDFSEQVFNTINKFRTQPITCAVDIKKFNEEYQGVFMKKPSILNEMNVVSSKLTEKTSIVSDLKLDDTLTSIAENFLSRCHQSKGFYAQDQDYLETVIAMELEGVETCRNYLTTEKDPIKCVIRMIYNELDIEEGEHIILSNKVKYIGLAHEKIKGTPVTIVIISDSITPKKPGLLIDTLIDEINRLRENPSAFIKYIPQSNAEAKELSNLLMSHRRMGNLVSNDFLNQAAIVRSQEYNIYEVKKNWSLLSEFLENFGIRYLNVGEYVANKKDTAKDFLVEMLFDENARKMLLDKRFTQMGIAYGKETAKVFIIMADNFEGKPQQKEITMLSLKRRLHRPNFTEDEEKQIQNDFQKFDVVKSGLIYPKNVLVFVEKDSEFKDKNPFYYTALKRLNTEENNANGVDAAEFKQAVKRAIMEYDEDFEGKWPEIFDLFFENGEKKKVINLEILLKTIEEMGFNVRKEDLEELLEKLDGDLDLEKFNDIMRYAETRFMVKKKNKKVTWKS